MHYLNVLFMLIHFSCIELKFFFVGLMERAETTHSAISARYAGNMMYIVITFIKDREKFAQPEMVHVPTDS